MLDLAQVPRVCRESLKEGRDYKPAWTNEERAQLQKDEEDKYLKQFETEPAAAARR